MQAEALPLQQAAVLGHQCLPPSLTVAFFGKRPVGHPFVTTGAAAPPA